MEPLQSCNGNITSLVHKSNFIKVTSKEHCWKSWMSQKHEMSEAAVQSLPVAFQLY